MKRMIRVLLFLSAMCLVLAANLWLISYARRAFFSSAPNVIAGMRVIGKEDTDGKLGITLAHMLAARLGKIDQEMRDAVRMLEAVENIPTGSGPRTQDQTTDLIVPKEVFEPLNIDVSVGGVEVGGILNWLHRSVAERNIIQISVEFGEKNAVLAGAMGYSADSLYLTVDAIDNDTVVSAAAYQMTQRSIAQRIPEIGALSWSEFKCLFEVLTETAKLNKSTALGAEQTEEFATLSKKLDPVVMKMDEWKALVRFAGDLARSGNDLETALGYYTRAQSLLKESDLGYAQLTTAINELKTQLAAAEPAGDPETASLVRDTDSEDTKLILASSATASILKQLGVTTRTMPESPVVGILGGVPPDGTVPADQMTIIGPSGSKRAADPFMAEYIGGIVQTIQIVSPDVHFVFSNIEAKDGVFRDTDILRALEAFAGATPDLDILLVTFGPLSGVTYERVFDILADKGIITVLAAGNDSNDPIPFSGRPVSDRIMIVAATRQDGMPADFTQKDDKVFWAPGEAVPVIVGKARTVTAVSGTTYAAAFGAAATARLLAEKPDLDVPSLLSLLRNTSNNVAPTGPKILNVDAAIAAPPPV